MTPAEIAHQTENDFACPPEPADEGGFEGPSPAELAAFMEAYRASYTNLTCPRCTGQHGQWQGRQIVPAEWIAESTRPHIDTGMGLQYGYQWWLGKVSAVNVTLPSPNWIARAGKPVPDSAPPEGFDYNRWLGPAPYAAFNHTRLASSWWFDYGGGMLTDGAIHHIDIILWAMKVGSPTSAVSNGGKFTVDDAADTPDTAGAP